MITVGAASVGRMLAERPTKPPFEAAGKPAAKRITAQRAHHVWHVELTVVPTGGGMWTAWLPCALPQCWPFCWWVAVVMDQYTRRVLGMTAFAAQPNSAQVRHFLGGVISRLEAAPKYLICDRGMQFDCVGFRAWAKRRGIRLRYGAIGWHGSLALVERLILSLKTECVKWLLVPLRRAAFLRELRLFTEWYNRHRPHMDGTTPDEFAAAAVEAGTQTASVPPPEPPPDPPKRNRDLPPMTLDVRFLAGRRHLPVVSLKRAA